MNQPRSKAPLIAAIAGLALLQQIIGFCVNAISEQVVRVPGAFSQPHAWTVAAAFVIGVTLLNSVFYSAAWFGCLNPPLIRARLARVYAVGAVLAAVAFAVMAFAANRVNARNGNAPTAQAPVTVLRPGAAGMAQNTARPNPFGNWAQVIVLVGTLVAGFRVSDVRAMDLSARADD